MVSLTDQFYCPGYKLVEDRRIRCAKTSGHGAETFETGIMNSCNPVFIELGERLGVENYYKYFKQFGLTQKTGIDLPGEAATIMHKQENVGPVELRRSRSDSRSRSHRSARDDRFFYYKWNASHRTSEWRSVRRTERWSRHFLMIRERRSAAGRPRRPCSICWKKVVSEEAERMRIEEYAIGKTATSQTLPEAKHRYISSFLGFAPG